MPHRTLVERFWEKVDQHGPVPRHAPEFGRCMIWTGAQNDKGYGKIWCNGQPRRAHVVAYEMAFGPVPEGLQVDHLCRNRACVYPPHLEAVTGRVNVLRSPTSPAAINARKTHCKRGHPFDDENTYRNPSTPGRRCRTCRRALSRW